MLVFSAFTLKTCICMETRMLCGIWVISAAPPFVDITIALKILCSILCKILCSCSVLRTKNATTSDFFTYKFYDFVILCFEFELNIEFPYIILNF